MSHVKAHYRMVDGKAVYIQDYENKVLKQQHPEHPQAQLHERTAVGKHKDGSWYLRATDSEDRGHIQEAADKHSIKADWRKAAAKHHGRTGVYDHAHVKGAPEAHQVMEELRSKAATAEQGTKAETSKATKEYQAAVEAHKEAADHARKAGLHGEAEHHEAQAQRWAALKGIKEDSEKTLSDFAGALKRYEEHPASKGGKHLDVDEIREIVMGYRGNRTDAAAVIHEDVSAFNKQLFAHRMALPMESPGETVTFLAGGGGSGKGTASKAFGLGNMSHTVVDGVLGNFEKADKMIQAAVASGRRAEIVMVHAPIERAVKNMVGRAVRNDYGRIVSLKAMAEGHRGAQETMRKLIEKYGVDGSKGVHLSIVDNSAGEVATAKMLLDKDEMLKALEGWKYGEDMPDRIEKSYNEAKAGHLEDHAKELRGVAEPLNPGESYGKHGEPKHQSRIHHVLGALDSTLADLRAHSGRGPEGAGRDAAGAVPAQREAGQGDRGAGGADEGEGRRRGLKKAFSPADIRESLGTINNRAIQLHQAGTSIRNLIKGMDDLPETASFREACKAYAECGGTREDGEKVIEAATRGHRRTAPFMKAMLGEVMADTSTPKSIEPDIQDQTIGQDTMDENSGRDMAKAHPDGYTQESRTINERMKTQEAQIPHQFERAKWTSPNGHPRCLICGDEEPEGGECPGLGGREVAKAWDAQRRKDLKEGKIKGAFAGPDESFPIAGPEDVKNAWDLAGHAADPDAVRNQIVAIAKEHGWESHLPTGGDGLLSPEERAADPRQVAKAHVAEHDRHLASGKVAHVQAYDNNKHPGHMTFEEFRKSPHAPKVTKILQLYTSEQRASHAASHRLHHRQRESIGEQFWTRDDHHGQGVAYRTREAALRAAHEEHIQRANSGTTSDEQAARGADIATGKVDPANYFEHHAKAMDATEAVDSWRKGKDPDNLTPAEHAEAAKLERKAAEAHKAAGYFITHGKPHTIGLVDPLVKKAGLHFGTAQQHERNAKWHEAEAAKAGLSTEDPHKTPLGKMEPEAVKDKPTGKAHPSAIEALEHAREAKNRANNEDHQAAATQAHNASRKAVEASHRANETEEPDAHAEAMVENHNAKDAHERARRKAVNPRTKESHEAAITGHLKAAEHHFEMRNPHQVTLPEAIAEEDHKNGMSPGEAEVSINSHRFTAQKHSKGLDIGGGTVPSAEAHYAAHEAHGAAAEAIRHHGEHAGWSPDKTEAAAKEHEARAAHHKFMGDAMMRARQANGRKMKKAFEDEAQAFLCFDSFAPYLQHRSLFKAHVREHYRTEGGKEIFVRQHERKAKDRMHYVRHTPTGTAGFHWAPDQEGAARSFAGKERLYNDIEAYPVDPELQTGEREGVNGALILGGMDGNGRFPTVSNALAKIGGLLGQYGFEWDDVLTADRFRYPSGSATIPIARTNQLDSFSPIPLENTGLHLSWYRLVEGKKFGGQDSYEVIAYLG